MANLDDIDLKIISELREDARQSFRELAGKLGVAEGTVYNHVNNLKKNGIITGFMAQVDYSKIGYDLSTVIGIVVKGGHLPEVEEKISREPSVSAVYDVTGQYDAIIVAKFKDRNGLNGFVKKLTGMPNVDRTYTMMVLNVVKEQHGIDIL
ncbi:MAG: Lrp/AsnC family transcriptional regulator [Candidatus Altiarchaeota archaeon]